MDLCQGGLPAGSFTPAWDELAPHLLSLNLDGASLAGQLPDSWARTFAACTLISLAGTGLKGSLPPSWHAAGAFPQLSELWLQDNPGLTGTPCQASCLGPQSEMGGWQLWARLPGNPLVWLRSLSADSSGHVHDMHCLISDQAGFSGFHVVQTHALAHHKPPGIWTLCSSPASFHV